MLYSFRNLRQYYFSSLLRFFLSCVTDFRVRDHLNDQITITKDTFSYSGLSPVLRRASVLVPDFWHGHWSNLFSYVGKGTWVFYKTFFFVFVLWIVNIFRDVILECINSCSDSETTGKQFRYSGEHHCSYVEGLWSHCYRRKLWPESERRKRENACITKYKYVSGDTPRKIDCDRNFSVFHT